MDFFKEEHRDRGGCPADWLWVNLPEGGAANETYHQEMINYRLTPTFDYMVGQKKQWKRIFLEMFTCFTCSFF